MKKERNDKKSIEKCIWNNWYTKYKVNYSFSKQYKIVKRLLEKLWSLPFYSDLLCMLVKSFQNSSMLLISVSKIIRYATSLHSPQSVHEDFYFQRSSCRYYNPCVTFVALTWSLKINLVGRLIVLTTNSKFSMHGTILIIYIIGI